jgi:predicted metal-dependent phosphoesterase TrpH
MIRADLHAHTKYSKDGVMAPLDLVAVARRRGIDCLAITDHDSIEGALELRDEPSIKIIVGEEVGSTEGEIMGLFLNELVPKGLPPLEVVKRIKDQGGLVCIPHPFDRVRSSVLKRSALEEILPYVDIMECFNARCMRSAYNKLAVQFATQHNLACSAGSDAHITYEVGRAAVEMPPFNTPEEFLQSLREGQILGRRSISLVHFASTWNKWRKRYRRLP